MAGSALAGGLGWGPLAPQYFAKTHQYDVICDVIITTNSPLNYSLPGHSHKGLDF